MKKQQRSAGVRRLVAATSIAVAGLSLSACTSDAGGDVVVGFYPLEYLATAIGGDAIEVQNLAQPGAEPHDMELTAQQVGAVSSASVVIYQKGLQPALDDAVTNERPEHALDVTTVVDLISADDDHDHDHDDHDHDHEDDGHGHSHADGVDPHVWLDPMQMVAMAEAVKDQLVEVDPDNEQDYADNYEALVQDLTDLDAEYSAGLAQCERTSFVTTHTAFSYLAEAYGLEQVGILGLSGEEPSPQRLAEVQQYVEANDITTIFVEQGVSDDYAVTVAEATGADTAVLNPLEVAPEDGDYLSAMQQNLEQLQTALNCT